MADQDAQLHALLDDALDGFADPGGAPGTAPARQSPARAGGGSAGGEGALEEAWAETAGPCTFEAPKDSSPARPAKGLTFDPLARQTRRAGGAGGTLATSAEPTDRAAGVDSVDVLSEGLSKLLAELAQAEEEGVRSGSGGSGAGTGPARAEERQAAAARGAGGCGLAGQQEQEQQRERDLHATLRALSEQAPSFGGATGEADSEEEMLRLLAEHLGALGGSGGLGAASAGAVAQGDAGGLGAPPEMASLMDTIMQQLLSKEVLYQPMKDIGGKYPEWLEAHKSQLSAEDYERYQRQYGFIQRICSLYENNPADFTQLVELLQQMQQCGQPPQEIVDELAPGMQFGPDGLPTFGGEEGLPPELKDCSIQ